MKERFKEKRNKKGRILRIGRVLPFTREQFEKWVWGKLGGPNGAASCRYCKTMMTALDMGFDHVDPVSQGGSIGLDNLDLCCQECNRLKGNLSCATFMWLLSAMEKAGLPNQMTVADRKSLEMRLKSGGMSYRGKFVKAKTESVTKQLGEPSKSLFASDGDDDF